jgi:endonuclease/exonuclease/phosphatase family metal-dependent hydrolase
LLGRVRLVTANLCNGRADPAAFARLVEGLQADVVAVQELVPAQAEALRRVLPYGTLEPAVDYQGMGIALRHPARVARLPLPRRDAFVAELAGPGWSTAEGDEIPVEIVNAHILAPHLQPFWRTVAHRRGQLRALEAYLDAAPRRPRALVGDLNATPRWPVYRRLVRRFTDAALLAAAQDGGRVGRTWGPWPGAPRLFRIDHVLVTGLAVAAAQVVTIPGSDHSALVVDVARAEAAT